MDQSNQINTQRLREKSHSQNQQFTTFLLTSLRARLSNIAHTACWTRRSLGRESP